MYRSIQIRYPAASRRSIDGRAGSAGKRSVARLTAGALIAAQAAGAALFASSAAAAPGAPGDMSYFDLARKDCLGTARNDTSKVWYTIADGMLSDVYSPTIDNTNLKSLQFIVTDGSSFTDLQSRDMTYSINATDRSGMACRVTYTAKSGRYRLITTYITDPARDSVVMHTRFKPLDVDRQDFDNYKVYVRYNATINGNGGGGQANGGADSAFSTRMALVSSDLTPQSQAANRDYAVPLAGALRADRPFLATESGFVGTPSDGLTQLDDSGRLTSHYQSAQSGNVVQTARIDVPANGKFTLALGFGQTPEAAIDTAGASLSRPFARIYQQYLAGWRAYDRSLNQPPSHFPGLNFIQSRKLVSAYWLSANVLKASEDKTFPGAVVASLASPWGQAVAAGSVVNGQPVYFGSYREVFSRDLYEAFTGLLAAGDIATAKDTVRFLFERQQLADGHLPRNSLLNGQPAPDTGGIQLDETADPILMALQAGLGHDSQLYQDHIKPAADYLVAHGPAFGLERWEEQSGYSPSTIAAEIAGLVAAAEIADNNHDPASARLYRATADYYQRSVKAWTVTDNGPYGSGHYFLRLSKNGDPNAGTTYNLGNGSIDADQRTVVDAGFLELTRLGELPANDPTVAQSLNIVDRILEIDTDNGATFYRYGTDAEGTEDGYGDCWEPDPTQCSPSGSPWPPSNHGSGHIWPVLAGERAEYELQTGNPKAAAQRLLTMLRMSSGIGLVPEQTWENPDLPASAYGADPTTASIGYQNGGPAGSAAPLTWAQAQLLRLIPAVAKGEPVEQPSAVANRYLVFRPSELTVALNAPDDQASVNNENTTVTGRTRPGAEVTIQSWNTSTGSGREVAVTANADGAFSASLPTPLGTDVITAAAATEGATGYAQVSVDSQAISGQKVLDVSDPEGDDNGPGTYGYPTASDFTPGSFDLTHLSVYNDDSRVIFRFKLRQIEPTFGNVIGAQLLDIYIRNPAANAFSTAAAHPSRNYAIASDSAWSRRIEIQGFANPVLEDAQGNTVSGQVSVSTSQSANTITVTVPKSALGGAPGVGWKIAAVLTGQDGTRPDQARAFAATPQPYRFGVCTSNAVAKPLCALDPSAAPKALDVFTPAGVSQSQELNPLQNSTGRATVAGVPVSGG
ncbi:glucodextranase DOMON-like domain-containing protein [Salinisphaera sp.]|uniref:glucodextranase DOMON-like domain-containing protein n=1 Tax=Salinisphaera sp. TaxID=1914330 RepID=UPI002D7A2A6E|nr:glucodextranase DOMON-like domain-containing protein [Salinisphaera sp.]HET7315199.1 glucodextranase DOMON-like domain-containing protein [Salinisphaera sp.]